MEDIEQYDAVIIGVGPAGLSTAGVIAKKGFSTLIVERKPNVGIPVLCGEFLPTVRELRDILPNSNRVDRVCDIRNSMVLNRCRKIVLVSPYGHEYEIPMRARVIDRTAFDQYLVEGAVNAGAHLITGTRLKERVDQNRVRLISGKTSRTVEYTVLIGADGFVTSRNAVAMMGYYLEDERDLFFMLSWVQSFSILDIAERYGGHAHSTGLWLADRAEEYFGKELLAKIAAAKSKLDPENISNPGKIFGFWFPWVLRFGRYFMRIGFELLNNGPVKTIQTMKWMLHDIRH